MQSLQGVILKILNIGLSNWGLRTPWGPQWSVGGPGMLREINTHS